MRLFSRSEQGILFFSLALQEAIQTVQTGVPVGICMEPGHYFPLFSEEGRASYLFIIYF